MELPTQTGVQATPVSTPVASTTHVESAWQVPAHVAPWSLPGLQNACVLQVLPAFGPTSQRGSQSGSTVPWQNSPGMAHVLVPSVVSTLQRAPETLQTFLESG